MKAKLPNFDFFDACERESISGVKPFIKNPDIFAGPSKNNIPRGFAIALGFGHLKLAFFILKQSGGFALSAEDAVKVKSFLLQKKQRRSRARY